MDKIILPRESKSNNTEVNEDILEFITLLIEIDLEQENKTKEEQKTDSVV